MCRRTAEHAKTEEKRAGPATSIGRSVTLTLFETRRVAPVKHVDARAATY